MATPNPAVATALNEDGMRRLYGMTGRKPTKEIAGQLKMSVGKIPGIWEKWEELGLVMKKGKSYLPVLGVGAASGQGSN